MNIKINIKDLISDAYYYQYADISDTKEDIVKKKPRLYFTKIQFVFIAISILLLFLLPKGFSSDFAGYVISGLSLFVGLFFTYVLTLLDKINAVDFSKYHKAVNADKYPIGVRLKNYFKKITVLSHYAILLSIVCILLLSATLLFEQHITMNIDICSLFCTIRCCYISDIIVNTLILFYRLIITYFLLDFLLITIYLVASSYDYIFSELNKIKLS